jgi:hypothetical protein
MRVVACGLFLSLGLVSCGQQGTVRKTCNETLDSLAGKTFLMLEAMPDKSEVPNAQARMKFFKEGDDIKVKYTAKSLGDVFTYHCEKKGPETLECREKPRLGDWCKTLMVYESGSCTPEKLRELGADGVSEEDLKAAIDKAKAEFKENAENPRWRLRYSNLGNALQGLLYVELNNKRCQIMIDDMYWTLYKGQRVEDHNPVGTNPFVFSDENWMFDHCADSRNLVDLDTAELPKDLGTINANRRQAVGTPVHYHYLGETAVKAEEGCSYSYDSYASWQPLKTGQSAPVVDGKVNWSTSHTWAEDARVQIAAGASGAVYHVVRNQDCGGKKTQIDVTCNATVLQ